MKKFILFFTYTLLALSASFTQPKSDQPVLTIDQVNEKRTPRRLHSTKEILKNSKKPFPSLTGLSKLNISSSAQFSEKELEDILAFSQDKKMIIIDLRMESHGFINGMAVSWRNSKNWANLGKTLSEIMEDEEFHLQELKRYKSAKTESNILTEKQLVEKYGIEYHRMPVADRLRPSDEEVDRFVQLVESLKGQEYWIHSHCSGGSGRSTSFLIMFDMLHNADKVSFDDIILRQYLVGGKDFTTPPEEGDWRLPHYRERMAFFKQFYLYSLEVLQKEKSISWLDWLKSQ